MPKRRSHIPCAPRLASETWARTMLIVALLVATMPLALHAQKGIKVTPNPSHRRVDVTIDGQPFTSYIWPTSLKKPVLYPLIADGNVTVTRGYPLAPLPGERTDHPHHAGLWFNYGNVNGFDFWNNSDAIKPENRAKMGSIEQENIVSTRSGENSGELVTDSVWITGTGQHLLQQRTSYTFSRRNDARIIDQTITLTALDKATFNDDKEGLLGMRVARWLESPDEKGGVFTDASGKETKVANMDNSIATGVYLTSEGVKGGAVWSTRGRWCTLTGHTGAHTVTIAILDNPSNPDYPTYWHARGYGLFAANPLGRSIFDPKKPALNLTLEKGQSVTFHYRILLYTRAMDATDIDHEADAFASTPK